MNRSNIVNEVLTIMNQQSIEDQRLLKYEKMGLFETAIIIRKPLTKLSPLFDNAGDLFK